MPTTECHCNACGHRFVHLTFKGDVSPPICPRCKGKEVQMKTNPEGFMTGPGLGSRIAGVPKGPS
jgi:Zn finger protein HypA/HybF involved in hydrogenase expression